MESHRRSTLLEKPVKISYVVTASVEKGRALEDPIRATMLDLLSRKTMSVDDLVEGLKRRGFNKAPTTVRHHLDILKEAGLVELVRVEEVRGGVLKYYASRARFLGYEAPKDFDERLGGIIDGASDRVLRIMEEVVKEHGRRVKKVAEELKPCPYCSTQHFEEYVLLEILHRALAGATQRKGFGDLLQKLAR